MLISMPAEPMYIAIGLWKSSAPYKCFPCIYLLSMFHFRNVCSIHLPICLLDNLKLGVLRFLEFVNDPRYWPLNRCIDSRYFLPFYSHPLPRCPGFLFIQSYLSVCVIMLLLSLFQTPLDYAVEVLCSPRVLMSKPDKGMGFLEYTRECGANQPKHWAVHWALDSWLSILPTGKAALERGGCLMPVISRTWVLPASVPHAETAGRQRCRPSSLTGLAQQFSDDKVCFLPQSWATHHPPFIAWISCM